MRRLYGNHFRDVETTYLSAPASETVPRVSILHAAIDVGNDVLPPKKISHNSTTHNNIIIIIISLWCVCVCLCSYVSQHRR